MTFFWVYTFFCFIFYLFVTQRKKAKKRMSAVHNYNKPNLTIKENRYVKLTNLIKEAHSIENYSDVLSEDTKIVCEYDYIHDQIIIRHITLDNKIIHAVTRPTALTLKNCSIICQVYLTSYKHRQFYVMEYPSYSLSEEVCTHHFKLDKNGEIKFLYERYSKNSRGHIHNIPGKNLWYFNDSCFGTTVGTTFHTFYDVNGAPCFEIEYEPNLIVWTTLNDIFIVRSNKLYLLDFSKNEWRYITKVSNADVIVATLDNRLILHQTFKNVGDNADKEINNDKAKLVQADKKSTEEKSKKSPKIKSRYTSIDITSGHVYFEIVIDKPFTHLQTQFGFLIQTEKNKPWMLLDKQGQLLALDELTLDILELDAIIMPAKNQPLILEILSPILSKDVSTCVLAYLFNHVA